MPERSRCGWPVDLGPAYDAARGWQVAAQRLENAARNARGDERDTLNEALLAQERALVHKEGLPGREWFKHMVYAPGFYTGYAAQPLSAIDDAVTEGDVATATKYRDLLIESMEQATEAAHRATG